MKKLIIPKYQTIKGNIRNRNNIGTKQIFLSLVVFSAYVKVNREKLYILDLNLTLKLKGNFCSILKYIL